MQREYWVPLVPWIFTLCINVWGVTFGGIQRTGLASLLLGTGNYMSLQATMPHEAGHIPGVCWAESSRGSWASCLVEIEHAADEVLCFASEYQANEEYWSKQCIIHGPSIRELTNTKSRNALTASIFFIAWYDDICVYSVLTAVLHSKLNVCHIDTKIVFL